MTEPMEHSMNCPVCLETMKPPIKQCEKGHSTCGDCVASNNLQICPLCRGKMTGARNYQLEDLISKLKDVKLTTSCAFASRGCKYILDMDDKATHELQCKNRVFVCEGKKFCNWKCNWTGKYDEIVNHFKTAHKKNVTDFKAEDCLKIDFNKNLTDVKVIDYQNGQQIFWSKFEIDVKEQKLYWVFQYVGLEKQALQYFYEFEVFEGATRKLKLTEMCKSDGKPADTIFSQEKCVALSFTTVKNFLNENGELNYRYRVMKIKRESTSSSNPPTPTETNVHYKPAQTNNNPRQYYYPLFPSPQIMLQPPQPPQFSHAPRALPTSEKYRGKKKSKK